MGSQQEVRSGMPQRVLETHSFPQAVPINLALAASGSGARRPLVAGSGEGQSSGRVGRTLANVSWSERGRPIKSSRYPLFRVHDASFAFARGEADRVMVHWASQSDSSVYGSS